MTHPSVDSVPYVCMCCDLPITAEDDGVWFITRSERNKAADHAREVTLRNAQSEIASQARDAAGQSNTVTQTEAVENFILNMPTAQWQVKHDRCLEEGENDSMDWYAECGRIRTFRGLLGMALHLEEKDWVSSTNLRSHLLEYSGGF